MKPEHTQRQTDGEQHRSQQLSMQPTESPAELPGYDLVRRLGAGAYGEVWIGVDKNTNRQVAVKFFNHRAGIDWQLLDKEVEKLVSLATARHVVQLLEVGWNHEPPYYVMEYLEQGSVDEFIDNNSPIDLEQCLQMFEDIATGMSHAHAKGILHCDLKPANILLDAEGHARLADFGQSRLTTDQSPALGTLFYMAPEQADLNAAPDIRWDTYGLGAILYTLIEGRPPYHNQQRLKNIENAGELEQRLNAYQTALKVAPNPVEQMKRPIDPTLQAILGKCLATDPEHRFHSVAAILSELEQ
ncbi:MAG: protein kinase, partial [Planctomycetaceae bacterium]|nr:protein kinase [Planctomycetaceae bacterium]